MAMLRSSLTQSLAKKGRESSGINKLKQKSKTINLKYKNLAFCTGWMDQAGIIVYPIDFLGSVFLRFSISCASLTPDRRQESKRRKFSSSWFRTYFFLFPFSSLSLDKPNTEEKMGKETSKYSSNADTANDKRNKTNKKNEI